MDEKTELTELVSGDSITISADNINLNSVIESVSTTGIQMPKLNITEDLPDNTKSLMENVADYEFVIPTDSITLPLMDALTTGKKANIDPDFVKRYFELDTAQKKLTEELNKAKAYIKDFVEKNNTGSIEDNGMKIVYKSATTSTRIDSKALKSKYPDIAAECSTVSATSSSVTISKA